MKCWVILCLLHFEKKKKKLQYGEIIFQLFWINNYYVVVLYHIYIYIYIGQFRIMRYDSFLALVRELWFVNSQLHALCFLYNFALVKFCFGVVSLLLLKWPPLWHMDRISINHRKIWRNSMIWISRGENWDILPYSLESCEILNFENARRSKMLKANIIMIQLCVG